MIGSKYMSALTMSTPTPWIRASDERAVDTDMRSIVKTRHHSSALTTPPVYALLQIERLSWLLVRETGNCIRSCKRRAFGEEKASAVSTETLRQVEHLPADTPLARGLQRHRCIRQNSGEDEWRWWPIRWNTDTWSNTTRQATLRITDSSERRPPPLASTDFSLHGWRRWESPLPRSGIW